MIPSLSRHRTLVPVDRTDWRWLETNREMTPWAVLIAWLRDLGVRLANRLRPLGIGRRPGRMTAPRGTVMIFAEPDYQYGVGPLRLRVDRVDRAHPYFDGEKWLPVEGVQLDRAGHELGRRNVLVRGHLLLG